jgi:transposase-like protein
MAETKRMTCEQVVGYLLEGEGLDFLRESLSWVVQQLMEAEVSELIGAERGERAPQERLTHRNGYRSRAWSTRAGELELAIPKLRRGSYFPSFLEPRRRSEQALVSVVQEAGSALVLTSGSTPFATGRSRAATPTCGWTRRWRRSVTAAASSARRWCSPTACTSPATGK